MGFSVPCSCLETGSCEGFNSPEIPRHFQAGNVRQPWAEGCYPFEIEVLGLEVRMS
jgi:hypothetical protein